MASNITGWSTLQVKEWCEVLGFDNNVVSALVDNKIDGNALSTITESELKECGIIALGDRKKLIRERDRWIKNYLQPSSNKPLIAMEVAKMTAAHNPNAVTFDDNGGFSMDVGEMIKAARANGYKI